MKHTRTVQDTNSQKESLTLSIQRSTEIAQEKGLPFGSPPSPSISLGLLSYIGAFQDTLALCYNCQPLYAPLLVLLVRNSQLNMHSHAQKVVSFCHNEIRDLTASLLTEVGSNDCIEPEI